MHFERLSKRESDTIKEVLHAAADGPFFPDWEFQTIFGITRERVRRIADEWPLPNAPPGDVVLAVNNSLNWLLRNYLKTPIDAGDDTTAVRRPVG
jgi:hypothetical protein